MLLAYRVGAGFSFEILMNTLYDVSLGDPSLHPYFSFGRIPQFCISWLHQRCGLVG